MLMRIMVIVVLLSAGSCLSGCSICDYGHGYALSPYGYSKTASWSNLGWTREEGPSVEISWPVMKLTIPLPRDTGMLMVRPIVVLDDENRAIVSGVYTWLTWPLDSRMHEVDIEDLGVSADQAKTLKVMWREPDGSLREIPKRGRASP